jgi:signal transduction histidine kinase
MISAPWRDERALESFTVAVVILDDEWQFSYVDRMAGTLLHHRPDGLVGRNVWEVFPDAVGTIFEREYRRAVEDQVAVKFEAHYEPLSLWVHVYAYPGEDGLTVIFQDITEWKEAELEAGRLEARNRAIIQALPDNIYWVSPSGTIIEAEHGEPDPPLDAEDMLGRKIEDILSPLAAERFRDTMNTVMETGTPGVFSFTLTEVKDSTDSREREARVVPVEGNGVLAIVRDVTQQRSLERQVRRVAEEERRRIGRDIHDSIGSLLSGIAMLSRGIEQDARDGHPVGAERIGEINRLAREGVQQARAIARGLNPIEIDADGLVPALEELAANTTRVAPVRCRLDDPDALPPLRGEVATQLYWIVQEAVTNAVNHASGTCIDVGVWLRKDHLIVRVRDDGIGLRAAGDRSGLGLQTMSHRAQLIGASLSIGRREEAFPGDGTPQIPTREDVRPAARSDADTPDSGSSHTRATRRGTDVVCTLPVWRAVPVDDDTSDDDAPDDDVPDDVPDDDAPDD